MVGRGEPGKSANSGEGEAVGRCEGKRVKDGGFRCFLRDSGGPQNHPDGNLPTLPASQTASPHFMQFMEHHVFVLIKRDF